jgi:hypothetical protein
MTTTVLCRCRVSDYDGWRPGYDHAVQVTPGVRTFRLWRGQDEPNLVMVETEPNLVMVEETFATREEAQPACTSAETQAAMEADGVDMSSVRIEYFNEVDSGKPADA